MPKKWRFFHASDFQSLMYPCFILCRILGIFPYKINNSIFEILKLQYILSIIIICALYIFALIIFCKWDFREINANFEVIIMSFETVCYYILSSFIATITLILSSSRMRLLQTIMEISSKLSPKTYQKLSRLIHTKDIFGFFWIISQLFIYFYIRPTGIFETIISAYTVLLMFAMDMLYINCVSLLKACFKEINNNLLYMQEFIKNEQCVPIIFYARNPFLTINLKVMKKQHLKISNAVEKLNIIFSLQILATTVITFFQIIFELHFYVIEWYNGLINLYHLIVDMIMSIFQIVEMTLLVWVCESGKNQAQEIRTTIHVVLNSSRDEQVKNELQLFSLQILHCKNTFSAKGFNVDAKSVTMIAGTITTYMLILLQFFYISQSCNGKSAINT